MSCFGPSGGILGFDSHGGEGGYWMVGVSLKDHIWGFEAGLGGPTDRGPGVVRSGPDETSWRDRS